MKTTAGASTITSKVTDKLHYVLVVLWVVFSAAIFLWLLISSLKANQEVFRAPFSFPASPIKVGFANYQRAWNVANMSVYFFNSIVVGGFTILFMILISAPAAYTLARIRFPGSNLLSYYFIAGLGIPYQLILIPYYVLMSTIKLVNSIPGLIVTYVVLQLPFSILLLISFYRTLPSELEDAAAIDGCTEFSMFWRIMFPLAKPGLITTVVFNFVWVWKEFLMCMMLIQKDKFRTLATGLLMINHSMRYTGDWAALFAALVIVIVPIFIAYVFISRKVISGLTLGVSK